MGLSIVYTCIKGCQVKIFKQIYCIISSDDLFTFTISEDFEEMWHNIRVNTVRVPVMGFPNYKELNVIDDAPIGVYRGLNCGLSPYLLARANVRANLRF